jgi:hypothetical protein
MNPYQEGTYYAIYFIEYHNDVQKEWVEICYDSKQISEKIKDAEERHKKGYWYGEELIYRVWKVTAEQLEINKVYEFQVKDKK